MNLDLSEGSHNDVSPADASIAKINHSPITITSNSNLQSQVSSEDWSGSGTVSDPYIITSYRIQTTGQSCISVSNTDLYLVIQDCNLTGANTAAVNLNNVQNARVTGNIVGLNDGDGIRLTDCTDVRLDNNTMDIEMVSVMNYNGIQLFGSDGNLIEYNRIDLSENDAIRIRDGSNNNHVFKNVIVENRNNGINLESDGNVVYGNVLTSNKAGIMVDTQNSQIFDNKFKSNSYGVVLHSQGQNMVHNNNFERNNFGIKVFISNDNEIYSNYILMSDLFGIDIEHSSANGNRIYDNSLFYNNGTGSYIIPSRRQARDISGDNIWNSPDNKGNFWYDWRSPDDNSDGVVDNWYFIDGGEEWDYFPMVDSVIPDVFKPPKLYAQPGKDHINLTWWPMNYGKGVRVSYFNIYKNERAGGEFFLAKVPADRLNYTDWDVLPGRSYYYYMTAVTEIAESNRSNRVKSSPDVGNPSVKINSPEDGSIQNLVDIYVDWEGRDNIAIDRFEITLDQNDPIDTELNEFYIFYGLSEGEHFVEVRIYDMAENNRSDTSTFTIDITPPSFKFLGAEKQPLLFNTDSPIITWTGEDTGPGIKGYHYSLDNVNWSYIGNVEEYQFMSLDEGEHTINLKCEDLAGNWVNDTIDILIDLREPTLYFIQPSGPGFYGEKRIPISYNAFDDLSNITEYFVRVDTRDWISKALVKEHIFYDLGEGEHHLYVKAVDGAGNEVIISTTGTIDTTPPELEILNLIEGEVYNKPLTFEWDTWDDLSGVLKSRFNVDGGEWRDYQIPQPVEIGFPKDGEHFLVLEVIDKAGNSRSLNISFSFDVSSPMVSIAEPRGLDVLIDEKIIVGFSESMDRDTVFIDAPDIEGVFRWEGDNYTLTPFSPLDHSKKYSIAVGGKDLAGNVLIPYNWYFFTEEDLSLHYGRVYGKTVTTDGTPIPHASYRFKTGEKGESDEEGYFDLYVTTGKNFIIVSNTSFHDTKVEFEVYEGETEDLGDIPLKSEKEYHEEKEESSSAIYIVIGIIVFILLALVIGGVVAFQVKKTKDYQKMGPVVDEWVNVTDIRPKHHAPPLQPPTDHGIHSEEGIQR